MQVDDTDSLRQNRAFSILADHWNHVFDMGIGHRVPRQGDGLLLKTKEYQRSTVNYRCWILETDQDFSPTRQAMPVPVVLSQQYTSLL